jgi:hypothetical protein
MVRSLRIPIFLGDNGGGGWSCRNCSTFGNVPRAYVLPDVLQSVLREISLVFLYCGNQGFP